MNKDEMIAGVPLAERLERFAGHYVVTRNPDRAYRYAFVVDKKMTREWIAREAQRLLNKPDVMLQVQELRDAAAAATLMSAKELMQDYADIANADPNELVSVVADSCRYCHGIEHRYQWRSIAEFASLCAIAIAEKRNPPTDEGGYGFDEKVDPALDCPSCFGRGTQYVVLHDTRKLSAGARKLYKGAKQKGDGSIEVMMHDQQEARASLGKLFGLFTGGIGETPVRDTPAIDRKADPQAATQTYLRLAVDNTKRA